MQGGPMALPVLFVYRTVTGYRLYLKDLPDSVDKVNSKWYYKFCCKRNTYHILQKLKRVTEITKNVTN